MNLWAKEVLQSIDQLRRPGSLALISGDRTAAVDLLRELAEIMGLEPVSVSERLLVGPPPQTGRDLARELSSHELLYDLEAVCWSPWLRLDPVRLLRDLARSGGRVAVWPGVVAGRTATFSTPDRRDYVSSDIRGLSVIRPVATRFPDEVPFAIERIPA